MAEDMKAGTIRRVGIVANPKVSDGYVDRLVAVLHKHQVEVSEVRDDDQPDGDADMDLVFVLGGDGTMLRASRMYPERVLLGVNLGKVGFMSGMLPEDLEKGVEKVLGDGLEVQEYRMLDVRVAGEEPSVAANDAVLIKKRPDQLISVDVSIGGRSSSPSAATALSRRRRSVPRPTRSPREGRSSPGMPTATCSFPLPRTRSSAGRSCSGRARLPGSSSPRGRPCSRSTAPIRGRSPPAGASRSGSPRRA